MGLLEPELLVEARRRDQGLFFSKFFVFSFAVFLFRVFRFALPQEKKRSRFMISLFPFLSPPTSYSFRFSLRSCATHPDAAAISHFRGEATQEDSTFIFGEDSEQSDLQHEAPLGQVVRYLRPREVSPERLQAVANAFYRFVPMAAVHEKGDIRKKLHDGARKRKTTQKRWNRKEQRQRKESKRK